MLVTKQLMVAIDYYSIFFRTVEVNGYRQLFDYQHCSKYIFLVNSYRFVQLEGEQMMTEL